MPENEQLISIVGPGAVSASTDLLAEYTPDGAAAASAAPSCVVRPKDAAEVQKLIAWANTSGTPLVPVSSGPPHLRGDSAPAVDGAVIVDLRGMDKVVRVDPEHRIALVEPGVTFQQLVPAVRAAGLRLNLPLLPRPTKSVVASTLEREPVIMPKYHWDISDPLACTEVVYGSGDFFKTGSAAGPGTLEQQWASGAAQNEQAGPIQADFLRLIQGAQGTMGIVTWATVRCEHLPSIEEPYLVGSENLSELLGFAHWLVRNRWADDCLLLNDVNLARIMADDQAYDPEELRAGLPRWTLFYTISGTRYFPEEKVRYLQSDIAALAASHGVAPVTSLGEISAYDLMEALHEPPREAHWKSRDGAGCEDLFFVSVQEKAEALCGAMMALAREAAYPLSDIGVYLQPMVQGVNYHCEFNLFFDRHSATGESSAKALVDVAAPRLAERGAFFSRPYGSWVDMAYSKDPATVAALRKVKNIFDPNNVMNPGKLCF